VLRHLVNRRREGAAWRSIRPYIIADGVNWASRDEANGTGTLAVTGYIRGGKLDVNKLVHLPGSGDFQLERIDAARDPHAPSRRRHKAGEDEMGEAETAVLAQADPARQEDLVAAVEPDMLDQEQTFPTEDELRAADEAFHAQRRTVRVPKGTSAYQAAWIVEDALSGTDDDFTDIDEDTDDGMDMSGVNDDARSYAGSGVCHWCHVLSIGAGV
jgi:pre-rRNA-processing protein TSR1